jgi:hypothetical protein
VASIELRAMLVCLDGSDASVICRLASWANQASTASATKAAKYEMRCEHMHETLLTWFAWQLEWLDLLQVARKLEKRQC